MHYLLIIFLFFIGVFNVNASSFTPTSNLSENTQTNILIDMAYNQVKNFTLKDFVILTNDQNYYIVIGDLKDTNNNSLTMTNTTIIQAIRTSVGYGSSYVYNSFTENETTISTAYVIVGNVDHDNVIYSPRFDSYKSNINLKNLGIFILACCFALFLTKERRF